MKDVQNLHSLVACDHETSLKIVLANFKLLQSHFPNQEEPTDPCPQCGALLPQSTLECGECKNTLPYCIVTGRHMLKEDWCECPHCSWPALYSVFREFVANGETPCPICGEIVNPQQLSVVQEPNLYAKLGESTNEG